jgi:Phage integrase family
MCCFMALFDGSLDLTEAASGSALIPQPYRTMVMVAQCTGLRAEEVLALEWEDIDFENLSMRVVRAVVHGRVKMVKTEYSEEELPLDPEFATVLLDWKLESEREAAAEDSTPSMGLELVFRSHVTGRHYHTAPIQQDYIRPAGCCLVECPKCGAGVGVWCEQDSPTREVRRDRVAHLPPHLPFLAGRYRGTDGSAAEVDAARPNLDHDERVRQRADGSQARRQHPSHQEGTEERITVRRTLQTHQKTLGVLRGAVIWGYLGLANRLIGCGGGI